MQTTMKAKNLFGFFAAVLAFVFVMPAVSAFASIDHVVIDSSDVLLGGENVALFADDSLDLRVVFTSDAIIGTTGVENDVRVTARILGEPGIFDTTERFDVLQGRTYTKQLTLQLPKNVDPSEAFILEVTVESNSQQADELTATLSIQRVNYNLEILSVESESKVKAGENLAVDVVVKNRGRQEAEDTFVDVRIPELGISKRVFLGDLSAVDQNDPDKFDSVQGRIWLRIPTNAQAKLYTMEIEAFADDSETTVTKRIEVVSAGSVSVISSASTKNFAVGQEVTYSFTIVNSGDSIKVYNLVKEADNGLTINLEESVVAVPAGSSKTVKITAMAAREGNYNFKVNAHSADGEIVGMQEYVAEVQGKAVASFGSAAVVLTIVLAIIFVVLLVVLIVLLTRKPQKSEEFGESYY